MADDSEDWVSAWEAIQLLKPVLGELSAKKTIVKRASDKLIQSRADRLVIGGNADDNVELPPLLWQSPRSENWNTGDFVLRVDRDSDCSAYGVKFLRSDIIKILPRSYVAEQPDVQAPKSQLPRGSKIFIGHGHSPVWRELKEFIVERLHLPCDEFNAVSTAGIPTVERLKQMLDDAAFAFLVLTAEDHQVSGEMRARENVVHEAGLFQGRHGFGKAIILLEEGCEKFSNIDGLGDIRFPAGSIKPAFEDVRRVLEREGIIQHKQS